METKKKPIFSVQKHQATHLHYDFRLEIGGVLKSWAVPKGPSMDPAVKRLAVEVEDHDLDYADYEGMIGESRHGSRLVIVWDRGWFEPLNTTAQRPTSEKMLATGKIDFALHGDRLKGNFSLILTKGKRGQWLLIKWRDAEGLPGVDIAKKYQTSVITGRSLKDMEQEAKTARGFTDVVD